MHYFLMSDSKKKAQAEEDAKIDVSIFDDGKFIENKNIVESDMRVIISDSWNTEKKFAMLAEDATEEGRLREALIFEEKARFFKMKRERYSIYLLETLENSQDTINLVRKSRIEYIPHL